MYGIVVSEFNSKVTEPLLQACLKGFEEQGIHPELIRVPGAVEIPLALQDFILSHKPRAMVALGCVIQGETDHYEQVCNMCSQGIMELMLRTHTPIVFEVLMTHTLAEAKARIQKGTEAAYTAVRMAKQMQKPF